METEKSAADVAFDNSGFVADAASYPPKWAAAAAAYRAAHNVEDIAYGDHPRMRLDLVWPDSAPVGLAVFVHGGYWMRNDQSLWTHLAEGMRVRGWAVALPGYPLTPEVRISAISQAIAGAIATAAVKVAGPVHLAGHSAGGHLVTRMACSDGPLRPALGARLARVLSISGIHELPPLLATKQMNATLGLDEAEARAESSAFALPRDGVGIAIRVGADERPELIRQSQVLADAWPGSRLTIEPGRHHFDIIEALADPESEICRDWLGAD